MLMHSVIYRGITIDVMDTCSLPAFDRYKQSYSGETRCKLKCMFGVAYRPTGDVLNQSFHVDGSSHWVVLTVDHGDSAVLSCLAGRAARDDPHRDGIVPVGLQLVDDVEGSVARDALLIHCHTCALPHTLDDVGVVVRLWGNPRAGDGGGALGAAVDVVQLARFCGTGSDIHIRQAQGVGPKQPWINLNMRT